MATRDLIRQLLPGPAEPAVDAVSVLHTLLDDATIETTGALFGIADAANLVRLTPHALRYYEQQGLVSPGRNTAGHRVYSAFDLRRLVFLARMRVSGMTMRDLRRYIELVERGNTTIPDRREIMIAQRNRIMQQQRELALALAVTEFKIGAYGGHPE